MANTGTSVSYSKIVDSSHVASLKDKLKNKDSVKTCCIHYTVNDLQLLVGDNTNPLQWCNVNDTEIEEPTEVKTDGKKEDQLLTREVSDVLHELADCLPFTGCLIDVILEVPEGFDDSSTGFYPLYGVLRRLKDWHNANITLLYNDDSKPATDDLTEALPGIAVHSVKVFTTQNDESNTVWMGKISVVDKTVNRGFILPGMEIKQESHLTPTQIKHPRSQVHGMKNTSDEDSAVLGRMLEVLDEVAIETVPPFLFTPNVFSLCQRLNHPHTAEFMEYLRNSQNGVLMRLPCYHSDVLDTLCGEKHLNTNTWKESLIADVTFSQEPEEELLPGFEYIHFLAYCKEETSDILLHQLYSPYQLNGQIFDMISHNALLPSADDLADDSLNFLSELPVICSDAWKQIQKSVKDMQTRVLHEWLAERKKSNQSTVVSLDDLRQVLHKIELSYLETIKNTLPLGNACQSTKDKFQTVSELESSPSSWSERCLLVYQESQRKSLSRLQSTDSVAMSSPVQSDDLPSTIDLIGFLKLFQQDGNPVNSNLSPVRKRHPSRTLRLQKSTDIKQTDWKECHYMPQFDVYYNLDKKIEKHEMQNLKLQDKHIKAETVTSGPSTVFRLPKKKSNDSLSNRDTVQTDLLPRRSPRKAISKVTPPRRSTKGSLFSPRKSAGRGLMSPRQPLKKSVLLSPRKHVKKGSQMMSPTRKSPRKKPKVDLNSSLPSASFVKPSAVDRLRSADDKSKRRHSVGDVELLKRSQIRTGRKSLPSANDSLNTSTGLDDSVNTGGRKESRSERHKRKLEEIVNDVLQQHGIEPDNEIFQSCSAKLFKVTKLFVMDLPTSQNLKQEMRNIAEGQVTQVVNLESRRQSIGGAKRPK